MNPVNRPASGRVAYLLDTNVLSELRKKKPDLGVLSFFEATDDSSLFISVLTLGELRKGIAARMLKDRESEVYRQLTAWLANWVDGLEYSFADRILSIDAVTARLWGEWSGQRSRPVVDTLLAATAVRHELTLVTRNLRDVRDTPVKLLNPWRE